jgi:subtilisin family serine protease
MRAFTVLAIAAIAIGVLGSPAAAAPPEGKIRGAGEAGALRERYIVVLKPDAVRASRVAKGIASRYGGSVGQTFDETLNGFTVRMAEARAKRLAAHPSVAYVQQDKRVTLVGTQANPPSWGLDRIDQVNRPLDGSYTYPSLATNVHVYVLDTGIRMTHTEFAGRVSSGIDTISHDNDATDCHGHGTHVAGTVGGTTYGVAKGVKLVGVRVLDCSGSGSYSAIIEGIEWVTRNAVKPAVANMSLAGSASAAVDQAIQASIASGVTYTLAAGNDNADACSISPARTAQAITVGASNSTDQRAPFSNWGTCLDIFAPGANIVSASNSGNSNAVVMSGTSMAAPHVAGAAALYLAAKPSATPAQVRDALVNGAVQATGLAAGAAATTTNRLLYTGAPSSGPPVLVTHPVAPPPLAPAPLPPAPRPCNVKTNGANVGIGDRRTVTSAVSVTGCPGRASRGTRVEVHIAHAKRGDLQIDLIAPNGAVKRLKSANKRDRGANVHAVYTANMSARNRNGVWKLRVRDSYRANTGYLDSWTLTV